jgi:NitT/TauT family transport system substrate-binding protein
VRHGGFGTGSQADGGLRLGRPRRARRNRPARPIRAAWRFFAAHPACQSEENDMNRAARIVAAFALAAFGPTGAAAQTAAPLIDVQYGIVGPSASEWSSYNAEQQGFFRDEGLHVTTINTGGPTNVMAALAGGSINIGNDGTDSDVAGVAHGLPIKIVADVFVIVPYQLMVSPSVTSWAQLKGKSIMLATKKDITAVAFNEMAANNHFNPNDVDVVLGGASNVRYAALLSGNVQGTILATPFDILAAQHGMKALASASDALKNKWIFGSIVVNVPWATANHATVVKFLRALRRASAFGYAHRDESIATLVTSIKVDPAIAAQSYDLIFNRWHAIDPTLSPNPKALLSVGAILKDWGTIDAVPALSAMFDPSYLAEASR